MTQSAARVGLAAISDQPLNAAQVALSVSDERAGATVTFTGVVRNHDHGRSVAGIEYVGHPSSTDVMTEVVGEFAGREGVHAIAAQHRVGELGIGGVALYVAVAASHRRQAFECASDLVDRIKESLPIWKKQYLADGTHEWSECP